MFNSQHVNNDPNPVLVAFREDVEDCKPDLGGIAEEWLWHTTTESYQEWHEPEHINHARKVLTRLVNVYGDS